MDQILLLALIISGVVLFLVIILIFIIRRWRRGHATYQPLVEGKKPDVETTLDKYYQDKINKKKIVAQDLTADEAAREGFFYLRANPGYTMSKPMGPIGTRSNKYYISVQRNKKEFGMSLVPKYSTAHPSLSTQTGKDAFCLLLKSLQHPYLMPVIQLGFQPENNIFVMFRDFSQIGSLKDMIIDVNPKNTATSKYNISNHRGLRQQEKISKFSRQILEGLRFLKSIGYTYQHLHSGNVIIDESGNCRLSEYENFYLGLTPKLNVTDPILAKRDIDLLQFGVVLYEMATGTETDINNPDMHPPACPSIITSVLEKVFGSEPISISDLLQMPLFTKATVRNYDETELIAQLGPRVSNFINNTVASSKSKKKSKNYWRHCKQF